ncbi:MAG: alpha/beta hydrolase [Rhodospirillales bacterium]
MKFAEQKISLSAGPVTYHVAGEGDPVLCLHGGGGFRSTAALEALAEEFQFFAPVTPGFDTTSVLDGVDSMQTLAKLWGEFADKVIKQRCHLLGHSFGGRLAAWMAVLIPDQIDQLVLEAPSGILHGPPPPQPDGLEALHRALIFRPENAPAETKSPKMLAQNRETLSHYYLEPVVPGAKRVMFGDNDTALAGRLTEINLLTLILYGTKDGAVSADSMRFIEQSIPRAFLIDVEDAAHAIEIDQPKIVSDLVAGFLASGEAFAGNLAKSSGAKAG